VGFSLKILQGPEQGRTFQFDRIQITVGRTVDNDVVLPDPGISRQHLSIRDKGGAYIVKDLNSSNGTLLNGQRITEEVLKPGDQIKAGGALILFEGPVGAEKAERPARKESRPAPRGAAKGREASPAAPKERGGGQVKVRVGRGAEARGARPPEPELPAAKPAAGKAVVRSAGIRKKTPEPEPAAPAAEEKKGGGARGRPGAGGRPGKRPKGLSGLIMRGKERFLALPKRMRIIVLTCVGVFVLLGLIAILRGGQQVVQSVSWYDEEIFEPGEMISEEEYAWYGLGPDVTYNCLYSANFGFKYASGRATLVYYAAGVSTKTEVALVLNKVEFAYAPVTLDGISDALVVTLPRKHLLENQMNTLQFINKNNQADPDAQDPWSVSVAPIDEQPLPQPDRKKAEEAFNHAKELYKLKDVSPANTYQALLSYQQARDLLELFPDDKRPDFYQEATDDIRRAEEELARKYKDMTFRAQQLEEFGRLKEAQEMFRQCMLTFPNQSDWRHQECKGAFDQFEK